MFIDKNIKYLVFIGTTRYEILNYILKIIYAVYRLIMMVGYTLYMKNDYS